METYPELFARRLFEAVCAAGDNGGYGRVRAYVKTLLRPVAAPVVRFETSPGQQGFVELGTFWKLWGARHVLAMVLGYSRLLWLQFSASQTMATVMTGLERAFAMFGGEPHKLLFDQMKVVVTSDRDAGGTLVLNDEFQRLTAHWPFFIVP